MGNALKPAAELVAVVARMMVDEEPVEEPDSADVDEGLISTGLLLDMVAFVDVETICEELVLGAAGLEELGFGNVVGDEVDVDFKEVLGTVEAVIVLDPIYVEPVLVTAGAVVDGIERGAEEMLELPPRAGTEVARVDVAATGVTEEREVAEAAAEEDATAGFW